MDTKVIDSRVIDNGQSIRRRRECEFCQNRFTTFERKGTTELMVIKKNGDKQLYDRDKLKRALMLAFAKRKIDNEEIESMINNLESERSTDRAEISSQEIGEDVLKAMKSIDIVAYIRFASVYKAFDNVDDFQGFIK
jgi:transcriptional repressor NrdR